MHVAATNQLTNKVGLVAGPRLVSFKASAATLLSAEISMSNTNFFRNKVRYSNNQLHFLFFK